MKTIIFSALCTFCISISCLKVSYKDSTITTSNSNAFGKKLIINGHWYGEGKKELLIREVVRDFAFLNQDLDVELIYGEDVLKHLDDNEYFKIIIDTLSGMAKENRWIWDVIAMDTWKYSSVSASENNPHWTQQKLIDFSNDQWFINAHNSGFFNAIDYKALYGGVIPGPIIEGVLPVMFLSDITQKKLGIEIKTLDMDITDFISYAKKVNEYNQTHQDKIIFLSTIYSASVRYLFSQMWLSAYGNEIRGNAKKAKEALKQVLDIFEQLIQNNAFEQFTTNRNSGENRYLEPEQFLFNIEPSWIYGFWKTNSPRNINSISPCEMPSINEGKAPFYIGNFQNIFAVPKNCNNPEGAVRFIKFITSKDMAEKFLKYSKSMTGLVSEVSYNDFGQDRYSVFLRHMQKKFNGTLNDIDLNQYFVNTGIDLTGEFLRVSNQEIPIQAVIDQLNKYLTKSGV